MNVTASPLPLSRSPRASKRVWDGTIRVSQLALRWTTIAFLTRFVMALLIHAYSLSSGFNGFYPLSSGADDTTYWAASLDIYYGRADSFSLNFYPSLLATFWRLIGGPDLLVGKLLNVAFGALSVGVGVLIVQELVRHRMPMYQRRRAANWTGALLTFYPSLLWYSTQLVKDPFLVLFALVALLCQLHFLKRASALAIGLWVFSLACVLLFRSYTVAALLLALMVFVLRFNRKWLVPIVLFMALAPYARGMGLFGFSYIGPMISTERIAQVRQQAYSIGGSSTGITVDYSNPLRFLVTYSYSFATAMFGPFPWQIRAVGQAVAVPETLFMWFLIPMWFASMRDLVLARRVDRAAGRDAMLLLFSVVLLGIVALFSDNIGANTRLRLLPWSAFFIFASIRLARKKWKFL